MVAPQPGIRLDKWLWYARFFKTRSLASKKVADGRVRVNGARVTKPALTLRIGDVVTCTQDGGVRVLRVEALGERRGPAPEAQLLYTEITPE